MCHKYLYLITSVLLLSVVCSDRAKNLRIAKDLHTPQDLTNEQLQKLSQLSDLDHFNRVLDEILVPRVVGTPNHTKVGNFIVKEMLSMGWDVEQNVFTDTTPVFGKLNFRNIIARLNPAADRFLVLACHYDSKYEREHDFVGATDSAVPCAMIINLAHTLQPYLKANTDVSLAFVFFDGEEAFRRWTPTDSIYGARHLAKKWQLTKYPQGENTNELDRIDIMVLLDLLGAPDPTFYSFFPATERWYTRLALAEDRLSTAGLLQRYSTGKPEQRYFRLSSSNSNIEDDHVPFLKRNVNILHVISSPFPDVWHTPNDNRAALDMDTIENLNKIFRVFVTEYLSLQV